MAPFAGGLFNEGALSLGFGGYFLAVLGPSFALGRGNPLAGGGAQYSLLRRVLLPGRSGSSPRMSELRLNFPYLPLQPLSFYLVPYQSHL